MHLKRKGREGKREEEGEIAVREGEVELGTKSNVGKVFWKQSSTFMNSLFLNTMKDSWKFSKEDFRTYFQRR